MSRKKRTLSEVQNDQSNDHEGDFSHNPSSPGTAYSDFSVVSDGSFRPRFAEMEEMSMDASSSLDGEVEDREPPWKPGDGIVPTISEFNRVYTTTKQAWASAADAGRAKRLDEFDLQPFCRLFDDVPRLLQDVPASILEDTTTGSFSIDLSMHVKTTADRQCDSSVRQLKFSQILGCRQPYSYTKNADAAIFFSADQPEQANYLSSIVLAWSYIFSCRWVQILQSLGKNAILRHEVDANLKNGFWDLVTRSRWTAQVDGETPSYSPWMLRQEKRKLGNGRPLETIEPQLESAYSALSDFCMDNGHMHILYAGFAIFLLLRTPEAPPLMLAPPARIPDEIISKPNRRSTSSWQLFDVIDKCMFLSSIYSAGASMLGAALFNVSVPCNLVGASSQGIINAVLPVLEGESQSNPHLAYEDLSQFIAAISHKSAATYPIWLAAAQTGRAASTLSLILTYLPPIHFPTGIMTNIHQTFLQCNYESKTSQSDHITRAREMTVSYWTRNEAWDPWSVAPPFGLTSLNNLSLEIKEHCSHDHQPISWTLCYDVSSEHVMNCGGEVTIQAFDTYPSALLVTGSGVDTANTEFLCSPKAKRIAENQSAEATLRLYNWHRTVDGGLWLATNGNGNNGNNINDNNDPEAVRKLLNHPWMLEPYQEMNIPVSGEETPRINLKRINMWLDQLEVDEKPEEQEVIWEEPVDL